MSTIKKIIIFIIAIKTSACAPILDKDIENAMLPTTVQAELKLYLDDFFYLSDQHRRYIHKNNYDIQFYSINNPYILGQCIIFSNGLRKIEINSNTWVNLSSVSREIVMFHEFGHCFLYRDHLDGVDSLGYPYSIMQSTLMREDQYIRYRNQYIFELFSK